MSDLVLTTSQQAAIGTLLEKINNGASVVSMSGAAGCGKTTSLINLTQILNGAAVTVTPTNKAAGVLKTKGVEAETLFAKFFFRDEIKDANGRKKLTFTPADMVSATRLGEASNKIAWSDIIVVDESSMLSSWALGHLRRMSNTLVLVGDANQLPPVNDRDNPRGFFCQRTHDAHLSEVLRNEGEILRLATAVRESPDGIRLKGISVDDFYPDEDFETLYTIERPQLICWRNIVRQALNMRARNVLGLGSSILPVPGDLMVCRNNFNEFLLNGTQVTLASFTWSGASRFATVLLELPGRLEPFTAEMDMIWFLKDQVPARAASHLEKLRGIPSDDEEGLALTYGYAITAHTAQGGEWPAVCVVDERAGIRSMAAKEFDRDPRCVPADDACRRWVYTAISRAQTSLFIVNERWTKS